MHQAERKRPDRPPTPGSHLEFDEMSPRSPPVQIKTEPGMVAIGQLIHREQSSIVANLIKEKVFITSVKPICISVCKNYL